MLKIVKTIAKTILRWKEKAHYAPKSLYIPRPAGVIFLFHTVETEKSPWTFGHRYVTLFSSFKRQLSFIRKHFEIVSTSALVDKLKTNSLKHSLAAIHFDDGFSSYVDLALPFLKKQGVPSTVFLVDSIFEGYIPLRNKIAFCLNTGKSAKSLLEELSPLAKGEVDIRKMNRSQFLSWSKDNMTEEMEEIIDHMFDSYKDIYTSRQPFLGEQDLEKIKNDPDVEIGSHTLTHPMLSKLNQKKQEKEILEAHTNLERLVGRSLKFFAYPYGGTKHFNSTSRNIIREKDLIAFSAHGGINYEFSQTDIKRITLERHSNSDVKMAVLQGV